MGYNRGADVMVLNIKLANGKTAKAIAGNNYVVQFWNAGKWHNEAVFYGTKEGYKSACELMKTFEFESRVMTFN